MQKKTAPATGTLYAVARAVLPKAAMSRCDLPAQPMILVRLGKIRIRVVAKRMSPAWRTFDCLNMADCLLLLFLSVKCADASTIHSLR